MRFSNEEKRDMIKIYYQRNRNYVEALQEYFRRYPERPQPSKSFIRKLDQNMAEYGSFSKKREKYGSRTVEEDVAIVLHKVCICFSRLLLTGSGYFFFYYFLIFMF